MSQKQHYEITFIINANLPENEHSEVIDFVKNLIIKNDGEITLEENLERKKFTYLIKKISKGVYYSIRFNIGSETIKGLEKEISLNQNILRSLTIKKSASLGGLDTTKNPEEKTNDDNDRENRRPNTTRNAKPRVEEVKKEEKIEIEEKKEKKVESQEVIHEEVTPEEIIKEEPKVKKKEEEKVEQNELDKKLDEILNNEEI